jgi:hypothetical protein
MDKPKPPILDYAVRRVMPMSQKVLLAATAGGAMVAISIAGVVYWPVATPSTPSTPLASPNAQFPGFLATPTTTWAPCTQPAPSGTESGEDLPVPPVSKTSNR